MHRTTYGASMRPDTSDRIQRANKLQAPAHDYGFQGTLVDKSPHHHGGHQSTAGCCDEKLCPSCDWPMQSEAGFWYPECQLLLHKLPSVWWSAQCETPERTRLADFVARIGKPLRSWLAASQALAVLAVATMLVVCSSGCSTVAPTASPLPPTATPVPATASIPPPTAITVPPTSTLRQPTATAVPATPTARPPTVTSVVPTATAVGPADMVRVPAGEFLMGSTDTDTGPDGDGKPQRRVYLDEFWIDKTEVTSAAFESFVQAAEYKTTVEQPNHPGGDVWDGRAWKQVKGADWRHPAGPLSSLEGRMNHPVVQVGWDDAAAFCGWAGRRLPTEAEWEKAARGTDGRTYPWGNTWDSSRANTWESGKQGTTAVGSYLSGASPYGVLDMAGNVWEWVADWYDASYYQGAPTRNPQGPSSGQSRVARSGGWGGGDTSARSADRIGVPPSHAGDYLGLRCASSYPP